MAKSDKTQVTPEMIQAVLAAMSPEQLTKAAEDRKLASLQPMIDEYTTKEKELKDLKNRIQTINPAWNPPTLADRIKGFIAGSTKAPTVDEVVKEFKADSTTFMIKKILTDKTGKLWTADKEGRFTVTE